MDNFTSQLFNKTEDADVSDEVLSEMKLMDSHIYSCFKSRAGAKVLKHMEEISLQAGFDPALGLLNGIAQGFSREGQLALIQYIKSRIARAERGIYK